MTFLDNYELWNNYQFRQEDGLTEDEISYWSMFHRWPLVIAVYLSMGQIPYKRSQSGKLLEAGKQPTDTDKINQLEDFKKRFVLAKRAAENGELVVEKIPDTRSMGHPYVEKLVPVGNFIKWARANYETNYKPLFDVALRLYKDPGHVASGDFKGKTTAEVKELITKKAEAELDAGCKCHHSQLAEFLTHIKRNNGSLQFKIPINKKGKKSIKIERWPIHVLEATKIAFRNKGVPIRTDRKDALRGRVLCDRHRDWAPPAKTVL